MTFREFFSILVDKLRDTPEIVKALAYAVKQIFLIIGVIVLAVGPFIIDVIGLTSLTLNPIILLLGIVFMLGSVLWMVIVLVALLEYLNW